MGRKAARPACSRSSQDVRDRPRSLARSAGQGRSISLHAEKGGRHLWCGTRAALLLSSRSKIAASPTDDRDGGHWEGSLGGVLVAGALASVMRTAASVCRSKRVIASTALGLLILQPVLSCSAPQTPAFPDAQGFGAASVGGRGGRVIEVTNLDDIDRYTGQAVPGSLRAAIEAKGPRIVVFRVSGTINVCELNKKLEINEPYITIAGQTAPGDGITLRLDPSCASSAMTIWEHDVVIRHIRFRPGSNPTVDLGGSDALTIGGVNAHDIIIDHCSFSWATDEDVDISWGARNVTVQYSIISEGLKDAPRAAGGPSGGYGMLIAEGNPNGFHTGNISIQRNIFADNWYRNPQVGIDGLVDYRNNVIYNWGLHGLRIRDVDGPTQMNIVGNYAKAGPSASATTSLREMWALHTLERPAFSYFVLHNIGPRRPSASSPELDIVYCREQSLDGVQGQDCDPALFASPAQFPTVPVTTLSPTVTYDHLLANAGATRPKRDPVDQRVVAEVINGTGTSTGISDPAEVGGWPRMSSAPAPADRDHDGMPDSWEIQYGMDPSDRSDGALDYDHDGYTNVEEFLNSTDPFMEDL